MSSAAIPAAPLRAACGLVVGIVVLGLNWPVMKAGLEYVDPYWMTALRLWTGAAAGFALLAAFGARIALPPRGDRGAVLCLGLMQMAGMVGLSALAMRWLPAGLATALVYTTPLWVTLIEAVRRRRLPSVPGGVSLALAAAGLLALLGGGVPAAGAAAGATLWPGVACALLAALGWSGAIIINGRHRWSSTPLQSLPWQLMVGAVPVTVAALGIVGAPPATAWSLPGLAALAYIGPVATLIGMWGLAEASSRLPATLVAAATALTPVIGIAAAALALGEPLTAGLAGGAALIVAGTLLRVRLVSRGIF